MKNAKKLYNFAVSLQKQGFSVIPVHGHNNPLKPKAAAISWSRYQTECPTISQLQSWYKTGKFGGLAIVCGVVSSLAVLDFDEAPLAALFRNLYPDLATTYTVRSGQRGLPHFYFRISNPLNTRSRSLSGVDWQYDGRYVIVPPTEFDNARYEVEQDTPIKILSKRDLSRIEAFLSIVGQMSPKNESVKHTVAPQAFSKSNSGSSKQLVSQALFTFKANLKYGRNNALFYTACWVRDMGGNVSDLRPVFDEFVVTKNHNVGKETNYQRQQEGLQTIRSAFSRSRRVKAGQQNLHGVPNSLREKLLTCKLTSLARILDAFVFAGWQAGKHFTQMEIRALALSHGIGDWSVRKALSSLDLHNKSVFSVIANPANAALSASADAKQLNAIELSATKPPKNRGRPKITYVVPCLRELCQRFDVQWTGTDSLGVDAVSSVKTYRASLHEALINRRPSTYNREWLAKRLNVSVRTLSRYNRVTRVTVLPRYEDVPLTRLNIHHVISDDYVFNANGVFIEDSSGKRYPPKQSLAFYLLSKNQKIRLRVQRPNAYMVADAVMESELADVLIMPELISGPVLTELEAPAMISSTAEKSETNTSIPDLSEPDKATSTEVTKRPNWNTPLQNGYLESLAKRLQVATGKGLSLARSRQLVSAYRPEAINDVLVTLQERGDSIKNPAGFVTKLLKDRHDYMRADGVSCHLSGLAEVVYREVNNRYINRGLSWRQCCDLVEQHDEQTIYAVLARFRGAKDIRNPAGFLNHLLGDQRGIHGFQTAGLVDALVNETRKISRQHGLSRKKACELINQYGTIPVSDALKVLSRKRDIVNPSGFIVVYLGSAYPALAKAN